MPTVNQARAIRANGGIEMNLGRVLPQARCHHMLSLRQGHPIYVVNHLANSVIIIKIRTSRQISIIFSKV